MAALCNTAGHYIFALWFLLLSSGFVGNLLLFAAVKEFCKSIKTWQRYSHG